MRIVQITEQDKMELSELGRKAVESVHEFLECLDKVTDGQISQEMAEYYGERRGVPGTGRYGRRDGGSYGRRDGGGGYGERSGGSGGGGYGERGGGYGERRGVPGTGRYGRREEEWEEMSPNYQNRFGY